MLQKQVRVLVAEDDRVSRQLVLRVLDKAGYEVVSVENGREALERLLAPDAPSLAVLDWMMPTLDGRQVLVELRRHKPLPYTYAVMLTARDERDAVVSALDAGADDYVTKPFHPRELISRLRVGERILNLERQLSQKVRELEDALAHVRTLQGLLPICMYCKKIRDERQVWQQLEAYIEAHSEAMFTHSLCESCRDKYFPEESSREDAAPGA